MILIELEDGTMIHPSYIRTIGPVYEFLQYQSGSGKDEARCAFAITIKGVAEPLRVGLPAEKKSELIENRRNIIRIWGKWS